MIGFERLLLVHLRLFCCIFSHNYAFGEVTIKYDSSGQIVEIGDVNHNLGTKISTLSYDNDGNWISNEHSYGSATQSIGSTNGSINTYDDSNTLLSETDLTYSNGVLLSYDFSNQIDGTTYTREWDTNGQTLSRYHDFDHTHPFQYQYVYNSNLLTQMVYTGNLGDSTFDYTYNSSNELIQREVDDDAVHQYSCLNSSWTIDNMCVNNQTGDPSALFTYSYSNGALTELNYDID